jgi:hypothetical protein
MAGAQRPLDYLRRLAATLHASEAASDKGPIGAIGILGSDVYDKLMVIHPGATASTGARPPKLSSGSDTAR